MHFAYFLVKGLLKKGEEYIMKELKQYIEEQNKQYDNLTFVINKQAIIEIGAKRNAKLQSTAKSIARLIEIGVLDLKKLFQAGIVFIELDEK